MKVVVQLGTFEPQGIAVTLLLQTGKHWSCYMHSVCAHDGTPDHRLLSMTVLSASNFICMQADKLVLCQGSAFTPLSCDTVPFFSLSSTAVHSGYCQTSEQ